VDPLLRRYVWRTGRKLYMWARKDEPNQMATNGELKLQRVVAENSDPSMLFIAFDVGARIGDWSKSMMHHASSRLTRFKIYAFEPSPESRQAIFDAHSLQIAAGNLQVNALALSDESRKLPFYVPHRLAGTSTLHPDSRVSYERVFEIETTTADEYCAANSIDHVDLLKVDTEGNDFKVIRGALGLLRSGRIGVLQFEYNHRWIYSRTFLKDVFDLIQDTSYRLAKVCSDGLEVYTEWHPELERYFETNYALVHERLTAPLGCRVMRIGHGNACQMIVNGHH